MGTSWTRLSDGSIGPKSPKKPRYSSIEWANVDEIYSLLVDQEIIYKVK